MPNEATVLAKAAEAPTALADGSGRISAGIGAPDPIKHPLALLLGTWVGHGFNLIWRPHHGAPDDHFLQLNLTSEHLTFHAIGGPVPNRGLVQRDTNLSGVRYLQQIHDDSGFPPPEGGGALHLEPGFWLKTPPTTRPRSGETITRLSSIPHGNSVLAQGKARTKAGKPTIRKASITPFAIGTPDRLVPFATSDLSTPSPSRPAHLPTKITQRLVDNPASLLADVLVHQTVLSTTTLHVTTREAPSTLGNIPFLGPNAEAVDLVSTFWIQTVQGPNGSSFRQLQYSQRLLLNFNGLSWPHVSVASLVLTGA